MSRVIFFQALFFLTCAFLPVQNGYSAPIIAPLPATINLYEDGSVPVLYSSPKILQNVSVNLFQGGSANRTVKQIDSLFVLGDSLIVYTGGDDGASSAIPQAFFNKAGFYNAWEIEKGKGSAPVTELGTFRILPVISTQPIFPNVDEKVILTLSLGNMAPGCRPQYISSSEVRKNSLFLTFEESFVKICIQIVDTGQYGPVFDLGKINGGTYTVFIEDSVAVGTFFVAEKLPLIGFVVEMKHPFTREATRPVSDVVISAAQYEPCGIIFYGAAGDLSNPWLDTTDLAGSFSLNLPRKDWSYNFTATKKGFHSQIIALDPAGDFNLAGYNGVIPFELIDAADLALGGVQIKVTNRGVPVESVSVSLYPARGFVACPMYLARRSARQDTHEVFISPVFNGRTDEAGVWAWERIPLTPYIDYRYSLSLYRTGQNLFRSGRVRLNRFLTTDLQVDFSVTGVETGHEREGGVLLAASPNPFNPSTLIQVRGLARTAKGRAKMKVFRVNGKMLESRVVELWKLRAGLVWETGALPSGVYFLSVEFSGKIWTRKLLVQR